MNDIMQRSEYLLKIKCQSMGSAERVSFHKKIVQDYKLLFLVIAANQIQNLLGNWVIFKTRQWPVMLWKLCQTENEYNPRNPVKITSFSKYKSASI